MSSLIEENVSVNADTYLDSMNDTDFMNEMESLANDGLGSFNQQETSNIESTNTETPEHTEDKEHIDNIDVDNSNNSADTNNENDNISVDEALESVNNEIDNDNEDAGSIDNEPLISQEELDEFKTLKENFGKLNGKITVDGKTVDGLTDPEHILEMQKAYYQLKDNKSELDEVAPIFDALKESGLLSDHSKLTMLLEASSGSKEAIKMLLKQNDIDPMELDTESIDEESVLNSRDKYIASSDELSLKDFYSKATNIGKGDVVMEKVIQGWGSDSLRQLVQDPEASSTVLSQLEDGSFDKIMDEISSIKRTDFNNSFSSKTPYEQYVEANHSLYNRMIAIQNEAVEAKETVVDTPVVKQQERSRQVSTDDERISNALNASVQSETVGSGVTSDNRQNSIDDMSNDDIVNFFESLITN